MKSDRKLVAHLMRRAGFGATPKELDELTSSKSYEEIVEDLILVATNQALDKIDNISKEKMGSLTGGMNIPGLF